MKIFKPFKIQYDIIRVGLPREWYDAIIESGYGL